VRQAFVYDAVVTMEADGDVRDNEAEHVERLRRD
jgi:hypothetical protein